MSTPSPRSDPQGSLIATAAGGAQDGFEILFGAFASSNDLDEAEAMAGRLARGLGFEYFSYVVPTLPSGGAGRGIGMLLASYPSDWKTRYRRRNYETEDTVIVEGRHERLPFAWGDETYLKRIGPSARRVFFEARDHGILNGVTVPVHGPHGDCGLFSVASPAPLEGPDALSGASYRTLLAMAHLMHAKVIGHLLRQTPPARVTLSERERLCLVWTSRGKTAWEIAQIIGRSKATVDFHIRQACAKLEASNKSHAAARAMQLDLL